MRENWQRVCRVQHGGVYGKETRTNERSEGTCHSHSLLGLCWIAIQEYLSIKRLQQSGKNNVNCLCLSCGVNVLCWPRLSSLRLCWRVWWLWCCLGTNVVFLRPPVTVTSPQVLSAHAAGETLCARRSQDVFRHPYDWYLAPMYLYSLFVVIVENQERVSAL